jgi:hypothetical protein
MRSLCAMSCHFAWVEWFGHPANAAAGSSIRQPPLGQPPSRPVVTDGADARLRRARVFPTRRRIAGTTISDDAGRFRFMDSGGPDR